jgi:hypothetical protein
MPIQTYSYINSDGILFRYYRFNEKSYIGVILHIFGGQY